MGLAEYFNSLSPPEQHDYATRCNTTVNYIKSHLIPKPKKEPRKELREALARESNGNVSLMDVLMHFNIISNPEGDETPTPVSNCS